MSNFEFELKFERYIPTASYNEKGALKFFPPVFEQRYSTVLRCLEIEQWSRQFKKVVEFGCAEMKFLHFLKTIKELEEIVQIDIDEELLKRNVYRADPLLVEYLNPREQPLVIKIYRGSIDTPHECLLNTDVVIGIEVIEHLFPETLNKIPENIFGFMKPKVVLFTTPNVEFNVLFEMTQQFRHDDHKFEWSREQFEDWSRNICLRYPDYKVAFYGIGAGPLGTEDKGCCSQMAVFARSDFLESTAYESSLAQCRSKDVPTETALRSANEQLNNHKNNDKVSATVDHQGDVPMPKDYTDATKKADQELIYDEISNEVTEDNQDPLVDNLTVQSQEMSLDEPVYRHIESIKYAQNADRRTVEQRILDEATYHFGQFMNYDYQDDESLAYKVPVQKVHNTLYQYHISIDHFRKLMVENKYVVDEDDCFILHSESSSSEEEEEEDDEVRGRVYERDDDEEEEEEKW